MSTPMLHTSCSSDRHSSFGSLILSLLLLVCAALPAVATPDEDEELRRSSSDTEVVPAFARVRYLDGNASAIRDDGTADDLAPNMPIYAGDRLDTQAGGRVEMQLPDGTMVRVDSDTKIELYDLLDPSFRNPSPTLLGVSTGVLQIDLDNARDGEALRIDTPAASIYVLDRGSFRIDVDRNDMVRISVERGRVEVAGERDSVIVSSGQRASVRPGGRPGAAWRYNVYATDSFDRWVSDRDDLYNVRIARGREYDDLPNEVRPYYSELSRNGRWVYADDWGWVWRPSVDDGWRPYTAGYWSSGPWGPVWVSSESWGWCTSRYGRWDFRGGFGWVWIPGRVFSPAHVYWYYGPEYVGWCPLGWWNRPVHLSISIGWGHGWFDDCPWWFVGYDHFYYGDVRRYQPPRGAVTADLRRGVVSRHAVVRGRDVAIDRDRVGGGGKRHVAIPRQALDRSAFDRAKSIAARRGDETRLVSAVDERDNVRDRAKVGFRERERSEVARRDSVHSVRPRGNQGETQARPAPGNRPSSPPGRPGIATPRGDRRPSVAPRGNRTEGGAPDSIEATPRVQPRATPQGMPRRSEPQERVTPRGDGNTGDPPSTQRVAPRSGDDGGSTVRDFLGRVGRPSRDPVAARRSHQGDDDRDAASNDPRDADRSGDPSNDASGDRGSARSRDQEPGGSAQRDAGQATPRDNSRDKSSPRAGSGGNTSGSSRSSGSRSGGSDNKPKPRGGGGGSHRH